MRLAENIVPLGDFKTHASRVLRDMKVSHAPVVITQHGRPAAVLLTPEEFDALSERSRFIGAVQEGLADAKTGRLMGDDELEKELDSVLGPLPRKRK